MEIGIVDKIAAAGDVKKMMQWHSQRFENAGDPQKRGKKSGHGSMKRFDAASILQAGSDSGRKPSGQPRDWHKSNGKTVCQAGEFFQLIRVDHERHLPGETGAA
jgi:hypothetical protein